MDICYPHKEDSELWIEELVVKFIQIQLVHQYTTITEILTMLLGDWETVLFKLTTITKFVHINAMQSKNYLPINAA